MVEIVDESTRDEKDCTYFFRVRLIRNRLKLFNYNRRSCIFRVAVLNYLKLRRNVERHFVTAPRWDNSLDS